MSTRALGSVPPGELVEARLQLHYAAQIVSAAGASLCKPEADFSHTALSYDIASSSIIGAPLQGGPRVALEVPTLVLAVGDTRTPLAGQTPDEGLRSVQQQLATALERPVELQRPDHELPAHPLGTGARFALDQPAAFMELHRYFSAAQQALRVVAQDPAASPVRLWPHHFDLATLVTIDAETGTSVGVGFSPGDGGSAEPYFYVTPWPYPPTPPTAALAGGGRWHVEGWTGALLTATAWLAGDADRSASLGAFLDTAIPACRAMVDGGVR